jgi:predicted TPR repeat methyltransferase
VSASEIGAARAAYADGRLAEAEAICRRILDGDPDEPEALHLLGRLALRDGNPSLAQVLIGRALSRRPNSAAFHASLGLALRRAGRFEESVACYERVVGLEPASPAAYRRLADAHTLLGQLEEAAECLAEVVRLDPRDPRDHLAWALVLQQQDAREEAIGVLRRGLELHPGDPEMGFYLAALEERAALDRAPGAFIARHFDRLAPSFDEHLQRRLHYRAPELLVDMLRPLLGNRTLDVLDAGCGTGLCGPLMRPLARRLVGVDLSPQMLERAAARGVYDELVRGDLVDMLGQASAAYDLIVATDVFIYFGHLGPPFRAAAGGLRGGGLFAFSVERGEPEEHGLRETARFAHGDAYVRRTASEAGLGEVAASECVPRLEMGEPVAGTLWVFKKPEGP